MYGLNARVFHYERGCNKEHGSGATDSRRTNSGLLVVEEDF